MTMKAALALLVPALVAASPQYIQCDLTGSNTAKNMATETTIMGAAVVDSAAIATASGSTYGANTNLRWTWDQTLLTQGFVKASAGVITGLSGATARTDCTGTAVAQYSSASLASPLPSALLRSSPHSPGLCLSLLLVLLSCYARTTRLRTQ